MKALTGLRIAVGILFLIFGEYKVFGTQFTIGGGFQYWINRFLAEGAYPFMVPVLKNFVLPLWAETFRGKCRCIGNSGRERVAVKVRHYRPRRA
jgi:hypothetical protein